MWLVDDAGKLPRGVPIILLTEPLSREPREPRRRIATSPATGGDYPPFTFLLSAPFLYLSFSPFFSLFDSLRIFTFPLLLSPYGGCEAFGIFLFFFSNHSTFPSLYIVASLSSSDSFYVSCPFFSLRPAPSRPVVGKSGAADLLWNLYCYRAPQQWSQPPHFSTPDLCYRSGFLSSYHENLLCEVIRPCFSPRTLLCIKRLYIQDVPNVFLLDYRFFALSLSLFLSLVLISVFLQRKFDSTLSFREAFISFNIE